MNQFLPIEIVSIATVVVILFMLWSKGKFHVDVDYSDCWNFDDSDVRD